jgi:hypothetical protein
VYEGAPPKVRERGGAVTVEYGPRFRPRDWGWQAADAELTLARPADPVLLRFGGGAREVTIRRPAAWPSGSRCGAGPAG